MARAKANSTIVTRLFMIQSTQKKESAITNNVISLAQS